VPLSTSAITLTLLLAGAPARQEAKRLFDAATVAYEAGRYEEALADFTASYAVLPLAQLLLDIAQCDRQLHRWKDAELQYQRYLSALPNAPNRAEVSGDLDQVRAEQVKAAAAPPARTVEALKLEPPPAQAPLAALEAPAAPRKHNRTGAYWLGGAGILVALAGGSCVIAGEVMAGGDSPKTKDGTTFHKLSAPAAVTVNNVLLASYVLFGVGAAALAGAGAWAAAAP
jgi:tetratricopeptide (TPR) repeat protein